MYRRDLLRLVAAGAAYIALPGEPGWPDGQGPREARQYAQLSAHLWQVYGLAPSKRSIYPVVHDQLTLLIGQLGDSQSVTGRERLCALTTRSRRQILNGPERMICPGPSQRASRSGVVTGRGPGRRMAGSSR